MFQTRNLLGTFENEFWSFIQSVNWFPSHWSVNSVNRLSFLWPIKTLSFVWRQNKPIRCREKLLIMADVFPKLKERNSTTRFLVCFTPLFPSNFKALPACQFSFVVKKQIAYSFPCVRTLIDKRWHHKMLKTVQWNNSLRSLFHLQFWTFLWRHLLSIRVQSTGNCTRFVKYICTHYFDVAMRHLDVTKRVGW